MDSIIKLMIQLVECADRLGDGDGPVLIQAWSLFSRALFTKCCTRYVQGLQVAFAEYTLEILWYLFPENSDKHPIARPPMDFQCLLQPSDVDGREHVLPLWDAEGCGELITMLKKESSAYEQVLVGMKVELIKMMLKCANNYEASMKLADIGTDEIPGASEIRTPTREESVFSDTTSKEIGVGIQSREVESGGSEKETDISCNAAANQSTNYQCIGPTKYPENAPLDKDNLLRDNIQTSPGNGSLPSKRGNQDEHGRQLEVQYSDSGLDARDVEGKIDNGGVPSQQPVDGTETKSKPRMQAISTSNPVVSKHEQKSSGDPELTSNTISSISQDRIPTRTDIPTHSTETVASKELRPRRSGFRDVFACAICTGLHSLDLDAVLSSNDKNYKQFLFKTKSHLKRHLASSHVKMDNSKRTIVCPRCDKAFSSNTKSEMHIYRFLNHTEFDHNSKYYRHENPEKVRVSTKYGLKNKLNWAHYGHDYVYFCIYCIETDALRGGRVGTHLKHEAFESRAALREHIENNHVAQESGNFTISCSLCSSVFSTSRDVSFLKQIVNRLLHHVEDKHSLCYFIAKSELADTGDDVTPGPTAPSPAGIAREPRQDQDVGQLGLTSNVTSKLGEIDKNRDVPILKENKPSPTTDPMTNDVRNRPERSWRYHVRHRTVKCPDCQKPFFDVSGMQIHMKRVHQKIKSIACRHCPRKFFTKFEYSAHAWNRHKDNVTKRDLVVCTVCGLLTLPRLASSHCSTDKRKFTCQTCGTEVTGRGKFLYHRRSHGSKVKCSLCRMTMRPACLPRHLALKHAASRPGEGLPDDLDSGDLDLKAAPRHGKPQPASEESVCSICHKKFSSKYAYQNHMFVAHQVAVSGRPVMRCSLCPFQTLGAALLRKHMRRHQNPPPEERVHCRHCRKGFKNAALLGDHIRRVHGEKRFQCLECNTGFREKYLLSQHISKEHSTPLWPATLRSKRPIVPRTIATLPDGDWERQMPVITQADNQQQQPSHVPHKSPDTNLDHVFIPDFDLLADESVITIAAKNASAGTCQHVNEIEPRLEAPPDSISAKYVSRGTDPPQPSIIHRKVQAVFNADENSSLLRDNPGVAAERITEGDHSYPEQIPPVGSGQQGRALPSTENNFRSAAACPQVCNAADLRMSTAVDTQSFPQFEFPGDMYSEILVEFDNSSATTIQDSGSYRLGDGLLMGVEITDQVENNDS